MHDVGEDRDGNLGPDGERNLAHPAGRVRPHRDRAGQHSGPGVGVELDSAQIVLAQVPRVVSLSLARAVTSRVSAAASGRLAPSWTGAAAGPRSAGALAIRSIRRTLAPFPGP